MSTKPRNDKPSTSKAGYRKPKFDKSNNGNNSNKAKDEFSGTNHPEWYAYNDDIMRSAANLFYSTPLGVRVKSDGVDYSPTNFPGVMILGYNAMFGVTDPEQVALSPINVAAQSLYSFVRHANSGSKNYESPDLMMYMMAMDSLYTLYAEAKRAYGVARTYSISNRYYPRGLLTALGWNPDDLQANLAQLRTTINNMAYKLGAFAIPGDMSYFARHLWMSSNIWVDSDSRKAQTYAYRATGFWEWEGFQDESGTRLSPRTIGELIPPGDEGLMTVESFTTGVSRIIATYLADEDVGIMTGDIKKAFGADKLLRLTIMPEDYMVLPKYDAAICSQIQNAVSLDGWALNPVYQKNGLIISDGKFGVSKSETIARGGLLNVRLDSPAPSDTMVATRLANILRVEDIVQDDEGWTLSLRTCGSEVINSIMVYLWEPDLLQGGEWGFSFEVIKTSFSLQGTEQEKLALARYMAVCASISEKFDWHPFIYWDIPEYADKGVRVFGDLDNFTTYTIEDLSAMNEVALLTQMMSPAMGTFNPATFLRV